MVKELLRRVPPHKTYIEPFFGAGHLFWSKAPAETEIINDLDPHLMSFYREMAQKPRFNCDMTPDRSKWERIREKHQAGKPVTACDFLFAIKYSFGCNVGRSYAPSEEKTCKASPEPSRCQVTNLAAHFADYKSRLQATKIHNEDWRKVVSRYDCKDGFLFCDPPYFKTACDYHTCDVNPDEIAGILGKLKCKVMVTLNDHPAVRKAFKGWKIERVNALYGSTNFKGSTWTPNLIIRNYEGFYDAG